jgi:hypothetical protein
VTLQVVACKSKQEAGACTKLPALLRMFKRYRNG